MKNYLHFKKLSRLTEQTENGKPVPYRILYAAKNGDIITPEDGEAVTIAVDINKGSRKVMFENSKQTRTLKDCLFLAIHLKGKEYSIIAN